MAIKQLGMDGGGREGGDYLEIGRRGKEVRKEKKHVIREVVNRPHGIGRVRHAVLISSVCLLLSQSGIFLPSFLYACLSPPH